MSRQDGIGAACAIVAISLVAWLSHESLQIAGCRDTLHADEFGRLDTLEPNRAAELAEFKRQLVDGGANPQEQACVARIGLPF
ncbi:hypothetical protein [Hyphomonas johnsonii]|nr:hypothetical protein [Hyphomonas johnsonii]